MVFYQHVSSYVLIALLFSGLVYSAKDNDDIFKNLGLDENISYYDLNVSFSTTHKVSFGNTLNLDDVKVQPDVQLETFKGSKYHTLVMVDPDAPSRKNPVAAEWLHWLVTDIPQGQGIEKGKEVMKFAPSGPPKGSGKHRYIFLLFSHDEQISQGIHSQVSERKGFKINKYAVDNGLGQPKAINFYKTENA